MKKLLLFVMILALVFACTGCNYKYFDTKWNFDTALIELPGGNVVTVDVKSWSDTEGEQLTITAVDGTVYMVSSINCILLDE